MPGRTRILTRHDWGTTPSLQEPDHRPACWFSWLWQPFSQGNSRWWRALPLQFHMPGPDRRVWKIVRSSLMFHKLKLRTFTSLPTLSASQGTGTRRVGTTDAGALDLHLEALEAPPPPSCKDGTWHKIDTEKIIVARTTNSMTVSSRVGAHGLASKHIACWLCDIGPGPNLAEPHRATGRVKWDHACKERASDHAQERVAAVMRMRRRIPLDSGRLVPTRLLWHWSAFILCTRSVVCLWRDLRAAGGVGYPQLLQQSVYQTLFFPNHIGEL